MMITNRNSTSDMIDFFQTSVTDVRCWKWFIETSQIITGTGQTHSHPYHYYIYIYYTVLQQYKKTPKVPPSVSSMHTHNRHSLVVLCFNTLLLFLKTGQTKSQPTVRPIADFLLVQYIYIYIYYADLNLYNTRNYQLIWTLTTREQKSYEGGLQRLELKK